MGFGVCLFLRVNLIACSFFLVIVNVFCSLKEVSKPDNASAMKYQREVQKLCIQHVAVPCRDLDHLISSFDLLILYFSKI